MKNKSSLLEARPDLAAQWDFEFNGDLLPENVSVGSTKKVGWKCPRGHSWVADPNHRSRSKSATCPYCSGHRVIPFETDLLSLHPELAAQWNYSRNGDLDPRTLHRSSNKKVWWACPDCGHEWEATINHRTNATAPTGCPYCSGLYVIPGVNDLESRRPAIAAEWDLSANAPLLPSQVSVHSSKCVQWICGEGHRWKTSISHRTEAYKPTNCPYCEGRRAIPQKTDLATLRPDLMREWDFELNQGLDPTTIRPHSTKSARWICERGHRWEAIIGSRVREHGSKCPYCSGRRAIPGETDLATLYPQLLLEWDSEDNENIDPSTLKPGSNKTVGWKCPRGHTWRAAISSRVYGGNNCPVCSGRNPDIGINDLGTLRPDLVLDWDDDRLPQEFTVNSSYVASWKCHECGTKWKRAIRTRTQGNKCPNCYTSRGKRRAEN